MVIMSMSNYKDLKIFIFSHFESEVVPFILESFPENIFTNQKFYKINDLDNLSRMKDENPYGVVASALPFNTFDDCNSILTRIGASLNENGFLIGRFKTLETRTRQVFAHHNNVLSKLILLYDFLFKRVLPKLPGSATIYKKFKLLHHQLISKCEALGRLRFCGFDIQHIKETDNYLYFIAQKSNLKPKAKPLDEFLIKVPKVGKNGKMIYCYKFRTMHPYANLLHEFILENLAIDNEGKVSNDFRMTGWGKFLRKTWLDEIPQLFNIIKGDLSIVGIRALTKEFLALYPEDWRNERNKYKPGFVPPYYVDCPQTFEGIIESEKKYCDAKKKHPIKTDILYFIKTVLNFVTGKARTG